MPINRWLLIALFVAAGGAVVAYRRPPFARTQNPIPHPRSYPEGAAPHANGAKQLAGDRTQASYGSRNLTPAAVRELQGLRREFSDFIARTRLAPEQAEELVLLVAQRSCLLIDRQSGLQSGRFPTPDDADLFLRQAEAEIDADIRRLLGPLFEDYLDETGRISIQRSIAGFRYTVPAGEFPSDSQIRDVSKVFYSEYKKHGVNIFYSTEYSKTMATEELVQEISSRSAANGAAFERISQQRLMSATQIGALRRWQQNQLMNIATMGRPKPRQ